MAKSANSKVIFLPGMSNSSVQESLAKADAVGEGPSSYGVPPQTAGQEYGGNDHGFQSAINSHVIENM
ncbi:hypothetical protein P154DRAFT_452331 [Amniculicola lignicola CBS 123094]|uniref:Uncharacterized protein n=1 Tax=Amniculicola lignicola CBS 123094 TaxID=1392246 RepID=A0A6A5W4Z1_9PLEO|nr:hypothetical protein P154DRAFT_452331 [Amniculicola lignicola CBS 123094]